jgi:hypothetical protein
MLLLATWLLVFVLIGIPAVAAHGWLKQRGVQDERVLIAGPVIFTGFIGYVAFFAFFLHPAAGQFYAFSTIVGLGAYAVWSQRTRLCAESAEGLTLPVLLVFAIGLGYLALLYLPDLGLEPEWQSQGRFLYEFPADANLPKMLGDRLYAGESPRPFLPADGWLSSDRPPLQAGLYLLIRPWVELLRLPAGLGYQCVGTLAQLCWLPGAWLVCRFLRLGRFRTAVCLLLLAASGFALFNSTYVWPKLLAGGYVLMGAALLLDRSAARSAPLAGLAAAAAALGWLAHGAAAFSLVTLALVLLIPRYFPGWKNCLLAAAIFGLLALPWTLYQKVYDPPANRLLKWHLAGVVPIDARTTWEAIRDSYSGLSREALVANKRANFSMLMGGSFEPVTDVVTTTLMKRKVDEFFYVFRSLGILNLVWGLGPLVWLLRRRLPQHFSQMVPFIGWTFLTLVFWPLALFTPASTILHSSSYAMMLALFLFAIVLILDLPVWMAWLLAGWHCVEFTVTWLPYSHSAPLRPEMFLLLALSATLIGLGLRRLSQANRSATDGTCAGHAAISGADKNYPLRSALLTTAGVLLVLFVRRPEAFLHPQFWAEDASVFYLQSDFMGGAALFQSYGGYHHLLLRLLAATGTCLDPLWIPAAFFWSSIAVVVAVTLVLFSRRLALSHRPWLALAVVLVPHTGEVFHSLTNAQWVSALGLILLLLTRDPTRVGHWIFDCTVAAVLGLTGVFSILFAPLFLIRSLARRSRAAWLLTAVIFAAASMQFVALLHTVEPPPEVSSSWFEIMRTLGYRVWASLLLPPALATQIPAAALVVLGIVATAALALAGYRQSGFRSARFIFWGSFAAIFVGVIYKLRGVLVVLTELGSGDRYFFLPKVLILWLLILEWNRPSPWRWVARGLCALALFASLAAFRFTPFHDYNWPAWAARIRANEPVVVPINPEGSTFTHPGHPRPAAKL